MKIVRDDLRKTAVCWVCHKLLGNADWMPVNGVPEHYRCIGLSVPKAERVA